MCECKINLGHLLAYLAKPEQNGRSGGALPKCLRHIRVCGAVLCSVPWQLLGVICLWLWKQCVEGRCMPIALFHKLFFILSLISSCFVA